MSNFVFRLFENLDVLEDDKTRFKLEIMVNRGAVTNEKEILQVSDHTIRIQHEHFIDLNKQLNFEKLEKFFSNILLIEKKKTPRDQAAEEKKNE